MKAVIVSTTIDRAGKADAIAKGLVSRRLAACVQRVRVRSVYRWKGRIETAGEYLLLAKTRQELAPEAVAFIRSVHPYELPEIIVNPVTGGLKQYLEWIFKETRGRKPASGGARRGGR